MNAKGRKMYRSLIVFIAFFMLCMMGQCGESNKASNEGMSMTTDYNNKTDDFWKQHLKLEVYKVCRLKGTEAPFENKYDHFSEKGTYYCACCGGDHPLYKSNAKFDSGTGWPSFWAPYSPTSVKEKPDSLLDWAFSRTEVVCSRCGGHLGHVFKDGPKEHTGLRYCMNSAALTFVREGEKPEHVLEEATPKEKSKS
jgi:peptide-methionine (R)-S-oxide reductase